MVTKKFKQKIDLLVMSNGTQYQWLTNGTLVFKEANGQFSRLSKDEITPEIKVKYPKKKPVKTIAV
jgi:hypothetical protein